MVWAQVTLPLNLRQPRNYIYENGSLKRILLPEGYYQGGYYYYYLKDHLGSNRVVIKSDGSVMESSNFYPSGMRFGESVASGGNVQPYRHIGKEMQNMHGLNWYDNGARMRQVDIPVWTSVDPLAEKYYSISPYAYCAGNPVNSVDMNGDSIWVIAGNGNWINYTPGMQYNGDDNFVCSTFDYLNSLYANDYGKSVVEKLSSSENDFQYTNTYAKDSNGKEMKDALSFAGDQNGGGEIHAGYLMDTNGSIDGKMRSMAHETFHSYQSEFGETGRESYREVEALLFQTAVMQNYGYFGNGSGNQSDVSFNRAMEQMVLGTGQFNQKLFNQATSTFLGGSNLNTNKLYTKTGYKSTLKRNPIISKFFPLMPK